MKPVESQGATFFLYLWCKTHVKSLDDTVTHLELRMSVAPYPINEDILFSKPEFTVQKYNMPSLTGYHEVYGKQQTYDSL